MNLFESIPGKKILPWLAACAVLLILSVCLYAVFTGVRSGGNCGDPEYNLAMIRENLVDYTDVTAREDAGGTPRNPSVFLLVHKNLEGEWILRYQSDRKLDKQQWTAEDLKRFDTVVIAKSHAKAENFREHLYGSNSYAVLEYVTLLYYDTAAGEVVKTETISADLPKITDSRKSAGIVPSRITEQACGTLGVPFISGSLLRACRIAALVSGIASAVLLLLWMRKLRKARA